jgi:hypothetical protein
MALVPSPVDTKFALWAEDMNRRYSMDRVIYRNAYPFVPAAEIARREVEVKARKERWIEKLQGMRD